MNHADPLFAKAREMLNARGYDYAIEMYIVGLGMDPDNVEAHRELREVSLQRKAAGGKPMGGFMKWKVRPQAGADDKTKMLALEKLLAYEPADLSLLPELIRHASAGGFAATAAWAQSILDTATRP
jgi:hypothetical protein